MFSFVLALGSTWLVIDGEVAGTSQVSGGGLPAEEGSGLPFRRLKVPSQTFLNDSSSLELLSFLTLEESY